MLEIYKMGRSYYDNKLDLNSGMTEVRLIEKELDYLLDYIKEIDKNVLVVINGVRDKEDDCLFEKIKLADCSIFIMSDSIAIKTSLDIINACDYCLHQAPFYKFKEITCAQTYSFIPELFYKGIKELVKDDRIKIPCEKQNKIYFGGNNLNRMDKFESYDLLNENNELIDSNYKLYEGIKTVKDERLPHLMYLKKLSTYKYSLVVCRKEYREPSWLTSRLFESLALDVMPLLDVDYDNLYNVPILHKHKDLNDLEITCLFYMIQSKKYEEDLTSLKLFAESRMNNFSKLITIILGNLT